MNTKFARILLAALSISALLLAGCGDDDDDSSPTGPGTTSGGTSGGTGGGGGSINAGNVAAAQGALTTAFAKVMALGPGTHNGAKGGTATVTIATGKLAQVGLPNVKYNVVFANYSDDGALYIDGPLAITANLTTKRFTYLGDLTLSGTYSAKMGIDLSIDGSSTPPKYSGTITVDGVPIPISG